MTHSAPAFSYRLLSLPLFIAWSVHAVLHAARYREIAYLRHRFGLHPAGRPGAVWLHAASVGEVQLVKPLADRLLRDGERLVVTTFTASGYRAARTHFPPDVIVHALPIDFLPLGFLFAWRGRFKLGLIVETELWPEVLYQVVRRRTPLLQINARLSSKSLHAPSWLRSILCDTLAYFDRCLTRSVRDRENLAQMGVPAERVQVAGNLKFSQPRQTLAHPDLVGRPYVLFASTHEPEEALFAALVARLDPPLLAVIAPRHPSRAGQIMKSLRPLGLPTSQRSRGEPVTADTRLYLADSLGEMRALMQHAELVVMGGSFNEVGGHNVLEPAALGRAVITGPGDRNIREDLAVLEESRAVIQVRDIEQLGVQIVRLLADPAAARDLGERAATVVRQQAGVLDAHLEQIGAFR